MRPSALLALEKESDYIAYCFDEAVYYFGVVVDAEVEKAGDAVKNSKFAAQARTAALHKLLNGGTEKKGEEAPPPKGRFKDPAAFVSGK